MLSPQREKLFSNIHCMKWLPCLFITRPQVTTVDLSTGRSDVHHSWRVLQIDLIKALGLLDKTWRDLAVIY